MNTLQIQATLRVMGGKAEGLLVNNPLYNAATLMPTGHEKACFYRGTQGLLGVSVENGER